MVLSYLILGSFSATALGTSNCEKNIQKDWKSLKKKKKEKCWAEERLLFDDYAIISMQAAPVA